MPGIFAQGRVMKRLALLFACLFATPCLSAEVAIPPGTTFFGVIVDPITSSPDEFRENQIVSAKIYEPLVINGSTVIAAETVIRLRIAELQKKKAMGRGGHISLVVMSTTAVDGSTINLSGTFDEKEAAKLAKTVGLAIVTPWTLFMKGNEATIPAGAIFNAVIPAETRVKIAE